MEHATIIGIDLAKRSFQLHGELTSVLKRDDRLVVSELSRLGCVGGRFGDASGDADDGGRTGRGGSACQVTASKRWSPTRLPQRQDVGVALDEIWVRGYLGAGAGVSVAGKTRRRERRRRRSVPRSGRCMGTAIFAAADRRRSGCVPH